MKVVAPGLINMAIVYFMGAASGRRFQSGHLSVRDAVQFPVVPDADRYLCSVPQADSRLHRS